MHGDFQKAWLPFGSKRMWFRPILRFHDFAVFPCQADGVNRALISTITQCTKAYILVYIHFCLLCRPSHAVQNCLPSVFFLHFAFRYGPDALVVCSIHFLIFITSRIYGWNDNRKKRRSTEYAEVFW